MSLDAEILSERERIDALAPEWHALAAACGEPMSAPAWMLTFSRELGGARETPRIVAVRDGGRLVGLAPLCVDLQRPRRAAGYRLLAGDMPRTTPLALAGREWEVAGAVAAALAEADPRPDGGRAREHPRRHLLVARARASSGRRGCARCCGSTSR